MEKEEWKTRERMVFRGVSGGGGKLDRRLARPRKTMATTAFSRVLSRNARHPDRLKGGGGEPKLTVLWVLEGIENQLCFTI